MTGTSQATAAVIQLNGRASWAENQPIIERLVREAAQSGAQLAVLPENLYAMPADPSALRAMGFSPDEPPLRWLQNLARTAGIWLVAGTLPIRDEASGKLWARSYVLTATGEIAAEYDKIHLFDVTVPDGEEGESYRESDLFLAGSTPVVVDTPIGRLGLSICFDLRFPELFRRLVDAGATVISLPAAFTETTGRAHWECLLRARAIENQVVMLAAGQVGTHASGRKTWGHSLIVDPWGQVLADAADHPDCQRTATWSREAQQQLRTSFPVLSLRRL
ncbi:carbon-nitrogen hydrolase family protein [Halothiobacillus sp. DCM-1]|uniref:carbon-nitrogen hydrolase family protein n=1 Tax=Halothiobacillus sp. DCM-1 TaxID=3112558 RepID=UPI003249262C